MGDRQGLNRHVPEYLQLVQDNSCGPRVVLMVADSFERERGRKLYAYEWSRVLEITMGNDLTREKGTSKKDLLRGLKAIGLRTHLLPGGSDDRKKCAALRSALAQDHPVIVSCHIPYKGKQYRHYSVVVGISEKSIFLRDSFPRPGRKPDGYFEVSGAEFLKRRWSRRDTVWGLKRWGVEVSFDQTRRGKW